MTQPTDYELRLAGFALPQGTDQISQGDDAIRQNAAAAYRNKWFKGNAADGTDWNTMHSSDHQGLWNISSHAAGQGMANLPEPRAGQVEVRTSNGLATQIFTTAGITRGMWVRHTSSGGAGTWGPWDQMLTADDSSPYTRTYMPQDQNIDEFHSLAASGVWSVGPSSSSTTTGTPPPEWYTGTLEVAQVHGRGHQTFTPSGATYSYRRMRTNSIQFLWTAWQKINGHDADILEARLSAVEDGGSSLDAGRLIAPPQSRIEEIALWGDSNMQSNGTANRIRELLPESTVHNYGRSGQYAELISARQGGTPATVTSDVEIPASGPVAVSLSRNLLFQTDRPALSLEGTLAGVHGTLSVAAGTSDYTFERTTPGGPVPVTTGSPFITDEGKNSRDAVSVFWVGGNNPSLGVHEYNLAMAAHLTPAHKRFIVMPCINLHHEVRGTQAYEDNMIPNRAGAAAFGDYWLDHRTWLIQNGLDTLDITPTQADLDSIAGDAMPYSLTSDGAHFIPEAQRLIGEMIHDRFTELGWTT